MHVDVDEEQPLRTVLCSKVDPGNMHGASTLHRWYTAQWFHQKLAAGPSPFCHGPFVCLISLVSWHNNAVITSSLHGHMMHAVPSSSRSILLDRSPLKASRSPAGRPAEHGGEIGCMIAPARRCPPFRDRDSLTDRTEKGAACTSGEAPWPWPMPPLVSRSGDLNLRHCTITYAGDGGRSADRDPAPVHTHVQSPAATAQQVGEGVAVDAWLARWSFIFFLFLLPPLFVCWAAWAMPSTSSVQRHAMFIKMCGGLLILRRQLFSMYTVFVLNFWSHTVGSCTGYCDATVLEQHLLLAIDECTETWTEQNTSWSPLGNWQIQKCL